MMMLGGDDDDDDGSVVMICVWPMVSNVLMRVVVVVVG